MIKFSMRFPQSSVPFLEIYSYVYIHVLQYIPSSEGLRHWFIFTNSMPVCCNNGIKNPV